MSQIDIWGAAELPADPAELDIVVEWKVSSELHTSSHKLHEEYVEYAYTLSIAGWTKQHLMDVICELGFSKATEAVLMRERAGQRAVRRIPVMIANYKRRRHMLVIRSLAYPEYDNEGQVHRASLPKDLVLTIMTTAGFKAKGTDSDMILIQ